MKFQNVTQPSVVLSILSFLLIAGCAGDNIVIEDPIAPTAISSVTPENRATEVSRNASIEIGFSEAMDPSTINDNTIIVLDGTTFVPTVINYSDRKAVVTPVNNLMPLTAYTVTVYTGAKTTSGKSLPCNTIMSFTTGGSVAIQQKVPLGYAYDYVIVGRTTIDNRSTSSITGNVALFPATSTNITGLSLTNASGYAVSSQVDGKIYATDLVASAPASLTYAVDNMVTAYTNAAARTSPDFVDLKSGNIGGKTLTPGLYKWTSNVTIPSTVVLSGDPNDVWIFQIDGDLTTGPAVNIVLEGNVLVENIFWQVTGKVTVGLESHFEGVILSKGGITLLKGASLNGQLLSQAGVDLDNNVIVNK
jgi:hypothetical protein